MSDIEEFRSPWDEHLLKVDHVVFGIPYKDGTEVTRIECAESNNSIYEFPALILWIFYLNTATEFENIALGIIKTFQRENTKNKTRDKKKIYRGRVE